MDLKKIIQSSHSKSDVCRKLNLPVNGSSIRKVNKIIKDNNFDISHFNLKFNQTKYPFIKKICPVCDLEFITQKNHRREKTTCSYSCSNTFFRSGEKHGNWNKNAYRSTCFLYHEKKCVVCDEDKIVTVHHYNKNHKDNDPRNLVPLCPTHHQYIHSKYSNLVIDKVDEYVKNFKNNFIG
jgi:hypothetical protein